MADHPLGEPQPPGSPPRRVRPTFTPLGDPTSFPAITRMQSRPHPLRSPPAFLALLLASTPAVLPAQEQGGDLASAPLVASATRVEVGPVIDGDLTKAIWQEGQVLTGFVQQEPLEGLPATERTEVRLLQDDGALYVGVWLYDSEPDRIVMGERRRNANLRQSDAFLLVLDTFRDTQSGFAFGTNPAGIEFDGQVRGGSVSTDWDGSWTVATSRDDEGWYAEFRIPFSTLRYGAQEAQSWGLNMSRYIGRKNEQSVWAPVPRQFNLYRLEYAGLLEEVAPPPRRVMTVTPYVLSAAQRIPQAGPGVEYPWEVGGDAKFGITQSLSLDFTVNTDFAQVEVDDQQVDLTRFSLFFPEKRPFFLENSGLFQVGSQGSAQMFHSRRIGVAPGGRQVPIRWGTRLSGRVGRTDVGVLQMHTGGMEGVQDPNHFTVLRVAQQLPNRSRVGVIATSRISARDSDDYGRTFAADARWGIGESVNLNATAGMTDNPGLEDRREAVMLGANFQNRDWRITTDYTRVGDNFTPEVGFVRRQGFEEVSIFAMNHIRVPQVSWLRELRPHARYRVSHSLDGFKETEDWHVDSHIEFENGTFFSPAFDWQLEGLAEPFRITGSELVIPAGTYSGWTAGWRFNTNPAVPVVFRSGIDWGSFFSGERRGGFASVSVQRGDALTGSVQMNHNRIRLPEGELDTTLSSLRLRYSFNPSVFVQSLVQYSDQTGLWTGNLRFGWLNTAGTGLFLVYNERQTLDVNGIVGLLPREALLPAERTFVVKYTRQFDVAGMAAGFMN